MQMPSDLLFTSSHNGVIDVEVLWLGSNCGRSHHQGSLLLLLLTTRVRDLEVLEVPFEAARKDLRNHQRRFGFFNQNLDIVYTKWTQSCGATIRAHYPRQQASRAAKRCLDKAYILFLYVGDGRN